MFSTATVTVVILFLLPSESWCMGEIGREEMNVEGEGEGKRSPADSRQRIEKAYFFD